MSRFSEKQTLVMTIGGFFAVVAGLGALAYLDWQKIYAAEITDENPEAADITEPEMWGEHRRMQEIQKEIDAAQAEADLIPKREQDVIVYREIVERDAKILPGASEVNALATTIGDFERIAGVTLSRISDLNTNHGGQAIATIPIKLEATGSFDEALKFINLFESLDRLVNTRAFTITVGGLQGTGRDAKAMHRVALDFVTYMYTQNAGLAKPVEIANYDKRKNDPVIQRLIRQEKAAQVEKYQLKPRINRRDPLVDPRRSREEVADETNTEDFEYQKNLVNRLRLEVELLREDLRQEEVYLEEKRYVQFAQIKPIIDAKVKTLEVEVIEGEPIISIPELKAIFEDDVLEPFMAVKLSRDTTEEAVRFITRSQVEQFRDDMRRALEAGDYEKACGTHASFESLARGTDVADDAAPLVEEMKDMNQVAQVTLDFERLQLVYSGAILREKDSRLIVNGRTRREGDYVDTGNRCRIKQISKDEVVYEFDGFEIHDPLKTR